VTRGFDSIKDALNQCPKSGIISANRTVSPGSGFLTRPELAARNSMNETSRRNLHATALIRDSPRNTLQFANRRL